MKKWIIAAVALIAAGAVACGAGAAAMHFQFGGLNSVKYETNTYAVDESFRSIAIETRIETIVFRPSDDGMCKVVCMEEKNLKHEVAVKDGTLTVRSQDNRKSFLHFGLSVQEPEIIVFLPEREFDALGVDTDTGDVTIPADFSFETIRVNGDTSDVVCLASAKGSLEIHLSTGDIEIADLTAGSIDLKTATGDVCLEDVICEGEMHVVVDTGDVRFDASDAAAVFVRTNTGDVSGTLLTEKIFLCETEFGDVEVPNTTSGGTCEIITDLGDISISIL